MKLVSVEVLLELFSDRPFQDEEFTAVSRVTSFRDAEGTASICYNSRFAVLHLVQWSVELKKPRWSTTTVFQ